MRAFQVGDGLGCGASADGRLNGAPIASDLSPSPAPQDLPAAPAFRNIYQSLRSYSKRSIEIGLSNASPVDMNIPEDFPLDELQAFLRRYADGETGPNLITLTCADLATYQAASRDPERYDLLRVRMGGWTEFYAVMFPVHQGQHQRRQYFISGGTGSTEVSAEKEGMTAEDDEASGVGGAASSSDSHSAPGVIAGAKRRRSHGGGGHGDGGAAALGSD